MVVCLLVKEGKLLLCEKMRKIGQGRLVPYGGNIEPGETEVDAVVREVAEESGGCLVDSQKMIKVSIGYFYTHKDNGELVLANVHTYLSDKWQGVPQDTEEMKNPTWYDIKNLPLDRQFPVDRYWLPQALLGQKTIVEAHYTPNQESLIGEVKITNVSRF